MMKNSIFHISIFLLITFNMAMEGYFTSVKPPSSQQSSVLITLPRGRILTMGMLSSTITLTTMAS